jgi:6-pyruvoyltetrahydropterin/6-carboxytetrahydropterin synthase
MMDIFKDFRFEAAHHLPKFPEGHKCRRLHGHSFRVRVSVRGRVEEATGIVRDFADVSDAWAELVHPLLDHQYLNKVKGLENPTAENLAFWIWDTLRDRLPLACIDVWETCTSGVHYMGWDRVADTVRITKLKPEKSP